MPYFSFLASTEAEMAILPPKGSNDDPKGDQEGGSSKKNPFEMISTSLILNSCFLASTEAEIAI